MVWLSTSQTTPPRQFAGESEELRDRETLRKGAGRGGYGAAEALSAPEEHLLFEIETGAARVFFPLSAESSLGVFWLASLFGDLPQFRGVISG